MPNLWFGIKKIQKFPTQIATHNRIVAPFFASRNVTFWVRLGFQKERPKFFQLLSKSFIIFDKLFNSGLHLRVFRIVVIFFIFLKLGTCFRKSLNLTIRFRDFSDEYYNPEFRSTVFFLIFAIQFEAIFFCEIFGFSLRWSLPTIQILQVPK